MLYSVNSQLFSYFREKILMESKLFHILQITNQSEVDRLKSAINAISGVKSVVGDHQTKRFTVQWADPAKWEHIEHTILEMKYVPETH